LGIWELVLHTVGLARLDVYVALCRARPGGKKKRSIFHLERRGPPIGINCVQIGLD